MQEIPFYLRFSSEVGENLYNKEEECIYDNYDVTKKKKKKEEEDTYCYYENIFHTKGW